MNRLVLAAAATLAFPAFALAADAPAYSDASSMYVSLHGGILMDPSIDAEIADGVGDPADVPVEFGFDSGMRWGGALGYNMNSNTAMELEYSNASFDADDASVAILESTFDAGGDGSAQTIMVNFVVGTDYGSIRPYVGLGLGAARVGADIAADIPGSDDELHDSDWAFAGQAFAGVNLAVTEAVTIGARYRYQMIGATDMTDDLGDPVAIDSFDLQSVELVMTIGF